MKRILAFAPLVIAVIFGGFFLWGLNPNRDPSEIPSVLIEQPAPEFELAAVEGLETPGLSRADLTGHDRPIVLNVFASWCVPCRAEHTKDAVRWLANLGNPYERIGSDLNGRIGIEWGISGVPESFIIGTDGTVLFRYVGPVVGDEAIAKFREALTQAGALEERNS